MTVAEDIGKFKTTIRHNSLIGYKEREIEFDLTWVSCGVYEMSYYRPRNMESHEVLVAEEWYPPNIRITFTPEHFEKVVELYPLAPKNERNECYKPFYEDYDLSRGMFDSGDDMLFQAFKDPLEDRVYLVNRHFICGVPTTRTNVLGLYADELQRLKELIDSKKDQIFYSGCRISVPS